MFLPVVMAGGVGSRLWPQSRQLSPKQFLPLYSLHTPLQDTLGRLAGLNNQSPCVICNEEHRFMLVEQSTYIPIGQVHSLDNPGSVLQELIEVQPGAYLGEDDIVRYDELYVR